MTAYLGASIWEASRLLVGRFLPDRSCPFDCDWSSELDAVKLREDSLAILHAGLWHTTSPQRFDCIARDQEILPNPPIPDAERWGTGMGPDYFPYVRTMEGVSLFDFTDFDPETYSASYPMSSWTEFVPFRKAWGAAIWIEIDRVAVRDALIPPVELVQRWKDTNSHRHRVMPYIEAAHLGPIPSGCWSRILSVGPCSLAEV